MALKQLDHVNVRTHDVARMREWYTRVLGMSAGKRPGFSFGGAWMYLGDQPFVHLVEASEQPLPYDRNAQVEHFAFSAEGLGDFLAHLRAEKVAYWCRVVPDFDIRQVNIHDPDGNHMHIDFAPTEDADLTDYDGS